MSYSRWSNSTWYTFWRSGEETSFAFPTQKRKLAQVFEICDFPSYQVTYGELMDKGIIQVLREVKEFYKYHKTPTGPELVELSGYIAQFQQDVDEAFTLKSYLNDVWHLKIKRGIIKLFRN